MAGEHLREVDPSGWDALLDRLGVADAYYSRGYVAAAALLGGGAPVLLHLDGATGAVVFPCLLRDDPPDVVSPYGYGGPLAVGVATRGDRPPAAVPPAAPAGTPGDRLRAGAVATPPAALDGAPVAEFATAYAAWCAERGVLSSFVVHHPLFANHAYAERLGFTERALAGTVAWRLDGRDLRDAMHPHHRRMVRRAERAGLAAGIDLAPGDLAPFVALYEAAMVRMGAAPFYLFPPPYWAALLRGVPLVLVEVRDGNGDLAAAVLGMGAPPWLHYHLGAASEDGRGTGAMHLALLKLAEWGQSHRYAALHLGGGVGGRADSLLDFKRRFAPDGLLAAHVGKAVHDRAAYARLTGREEIDWDGFFPAYRAPR